MAQGPARESVHGDDSWGENYFRVFLNGLVVFVWDGWRAAAEMCFVFVVG